MCGNDSSLHQYGEKSRNTGNVHVLTFMALKKAQVGWDSTNVTCYVRAFLNRITAVTSYGCTRNILRFLLRFFQKMRTFSKEDAKCWDFASTHPKTAQFLRGAYPSS